MNRKIKAAIIGASGYTGAELLRILLVHPNVEVVALAADSNAGKEMAEIYPQFHAANLPKAVKLEAIDFKDIDAVFCGLPHATSQEVIKKLPSHLKIFDLSADFRMQDVALYEKWYGHKHSAVELQKEAVYGLTEIYRDKIKAARLIACPGCYPTSILLPLMPLIAAGAVDKNEIIVDSKSGTTGAGRSAKQEQLFAEVNDGISAYGITGHRHSAEISENLGTDLTFVPHLMPMNRGILSTIYVKTTHSVAEIRAILEKKYANEHFVKLLPEGVRPMTHHVRGSNYCFMNVFAGQKAGQVIIVSVIDNLAKGASGQAIQNFNLVFGFPETSSLQQTAVFP